MHGCSTRLGERNVYCALRRRGSRHQRTAALRRCGSPCHHRGAGALRLPRRQRWHGQIDRAWHTLPCSGLEALQLCAQPLRGAIPRASSQSRRKLAMNWVNALAACRRHQACLPLAAGYVSAHSLRQSNVVTRWSQFTRQAESRLRRQSEARPTMRRAPVRRGGRSQSAARRRFMPCAFCGMRSRCGCIPRPPLPSQRRDRPPPRELH